MYNFDQINERHNTNSIKYDEGPAKNKDIIPMWVADMDFEVLPEIKEALIKRAEHGIFGYAKVTDEYKKAVQSWMKTRHDFEIDTDWIVTTPGVVTALRLAIQAYTKENDNVLILRPVYHPFEYTVVQSGRTVVECPLNIEKNYEIDFDVFEKLIITHNVKLFILCNPHNPIGKVWKKEDLLKIGTICKKHNVIIVSDEIHMDFVYPGHIHIPFYNVEESFKDIAVICTAPSKTFNLASLHTSNIVIANPQLKEAFIEVKNKNGVGDPNIFGLDACQAAYTYGHQWVDELVLYLHNNMTYMQDYIENHIPQIHMIKPEGLYLAWIDMRELGLSNDELHDFMLNEAKIWVNDGYVFGLGGDGFIRVNVATPLSNLMKALKQLEEAIKNK